MSPLVPLTMFSWIPVILFLFARLSPQWAVITGFIAAWLFLPEAAFPLPGLPDYAKMSATCYGIGLATLVFNWHLVKAYKPSWLDVPIVIWCISPVFSSLSNGLGLYDGVSTALFQSAVWGLPYFIGRIYLDSFDGLRKLSIGMFVGGLIYIPLCLFESVMSPVLHQRIYGFTTITDWSQAARYGAWRPQVFMSDGLMVGAWMMSAALLGVWMWQAGTITRIQDLPVIKQFRELPIVHRIIPATFPMGALVGLMVFGAISVRSTGAWLLLALGLIYMYVARYFKTSIFVLALVGIMSLYLYVGVTGAFSGEQIVNVAAQVINEERAGSLEFRFNNEEILSEKARERMVFGWGGWARNMVYDVEGEEVSITDSLWIIEFGQRGVVGLMGFFLSFLSPTLAFIRCFPAKLWLHRTVAPAAGLMIVVVLYVFDCLLNAMINPVFTLALGGIAGLVVHQVPNREPGVQLSTGKHYLLAKRQGS